MTFNFSDLINSLYSSMRVITSHWDETGKFLESAVPTNLNINRVFKASGVDKALITKARMGQPSIHITPINCVWCALNLDGKLYVLGPSLLTPLERDEVTKHYQSRGHSRGEALELSSEYESYPIVQYWLLISIYRFLFQLITGTSSGDVEKDSIDECITTAVEGLNDENTIRQLERRNFIQAAKVEQYIVDCVKNGDLERLVNPPSDSAIPLPSLAPEFLRSAKNNLIIAISLACRAAIEGGLPISTAFTLSDLYILQIEQATQVQDANRICTSAFVDYTTRVMENRNSRFYSKVIYDCCGYITANIHRRLRLQDIAGHLGIHSDTLSRKFSQETGMTITEYIRSQKINEAKNLLKYTDKSIVEISNLLAYSSQSHFISAFKHEEGRTPNEYRISNQQ